MTGSVWTRRGAVVGGAAFWAGHVLAQPVTTPTAVAAAAPTPPGPATLATGLDDADRMTADVFVGGAGPFPFLVDTGADHSCISAELAAELGLPQGPEIAIHGVAGVVVRPSVICPDMVVGGRHLRAIALPLLNRVDVGAAGVLAVDALQGQRAVFDFARCRIDIETSPPRAAFDEVVVSAHSRFGQLVLVDSSVEDHPVLVVIDTGAEGTIANEAFRRLLRLRPPTNPADRTDILSVTGQTTTGDWSTAPTVRVGGFLLNHLPVVFSDLHSFVRWRLQDQPALLLGMDVLRKFEVVQIDFARREVRFRGLHAEGPRQLHSASRLA